MKKIVRTMHAVKIPMWALCYLVNSEDSGLDAGDRKIVDEWVEKTRNGGTMYNYMEG